MSMCVCIHSMSPYHSSHKGYATPNALLVICILLCEEVDEVLLFGPDAAGEESPENEDEDDDAERVAEEYLGADSPREEARVAGMPDDGIKAVLD